MRLDPRPHTMTTERSRHLAAHPSSPFQRAILARIRTILVGHAVDLATAQPPPTTTAKSKPTPPLAQHGLRQPRSPGPDSGRRRAGRGHGGRPRRPRPSQPCDCLPHRRPLRPHSGRTQRTRNGWTLDAHTGHWTPDAERLDAQTPAPDTGHRSHGQARVDTVRSHRTLAAGRWPRTRTR
jgi:hypothetical protein